MICNNCGKQTDDRAQKCIHCGAPVTNAVQKPKNNKGMVIALSVAIAVLVMTIIGLLVALGIMGIYKNKADTGNEASDSYSDAAAVTTQEAFQDDTQMTEKTTQAPVTTTKSPVTTKPYVQGQSISLNSKLQYDMNIFLSNFSESGITSFTDRPSVEDLAMFSEFYNFFNRYDKTVVFGEYFKNGVFIGNYRIKEEYGISAIKKFFGITVEPGFAEGCYNYYDGYFYGHFTGAHYTEGFSIVHDLKYIGGDIYEAEFKIFESGGVDAPYYSSTLEEVEGMLGREDIYLRRAGSGIARIKVGNINDRTTYLLDEYYVARNNY